MSIFNIEFPLRKNYKILTFDVKKGEKYSIQDMKKYSSYGQKS